MKKREEFYMNYDISKFYENLYKNEGLAEENIIHGRIMHIFPFFGLYCPI